MKKIKYGKRIGLWQVYYYPTAESVYLRSKPSKTEIIRLAYDMSWDKYLTKDDIDDCLEVYKYYAYGELKTKL